jgi:hypothetical protein
MQKGSLIPRKIFEVIIGSVTYDVYNIEGKEHEGLNGEPKTWWIYYTDRVPEGILPPHDSESWQPWSKSLNRRLWDIRFTEHNSAKEKWGSTQFRSGLNCQMICNGKLIYSFPTNNLSFAMAKAQYLMVIMSEHSYNFFNPEEETGRKIWWYNLPATIQPKINSYPWEISIIPDYSVVSEDKWWSEYKRRSSPPIQNEEDSEMDEDDFNEAKSYGKINWGDALSDGHINWHRN